MADVTISGLTNRQPNSSAVFPYSEGGTTYNASLSNILPKGLISMWYGSLATIPSGWSLCDGSNGTPDLRERFVVGAGGNNPTVDGTAYSVGDSGGANSVTLTINEMPAHNHTAAIRSYTVGGGGNGPWPIVGGTANAGGSISMNNTGGDQPHENHLLIMLLHI